ncbi:MAG: CvpA family protein [Planctomycetota bacterium]
MASIAVLLIMAGCAALQFLKGSFIKSFTAFMAALCASFVAFGWFEQLADLLFIRRDMLPDWGQLISFAVLFAVTFAILQTIITLLSRHPINLGIMPERIGRIVFGLALGLIVSGVLLTTVAMSPLSNSYPYPRFQSGRSDPGKPSKTLFNPDGFVTGWFAISSSGSLSGANSFAVLHADFLDQLFFSRYQTSKSISVLAPAGSIKLPDKTVAWPAPQGIKNDSGEPLASKDLIIVRVGFTNAIMRTGGVFTAGQLRLICKEKDDKEPFRGGAVIAYPEGFLKAPDQLQKTGRGEQIKVEAADIKDGVKWFDFAFYIPTDSRPVAISFKENIILAVPPMASAEQAPK